MSHLPLRLAVLAVVAFGAVAAPAPAATVCVPDASPGGCDSVATTIQGAVDAAASGDTIKIAAGRYEEAVDAGDKTLHFVGAGATATTIAAPEPEGDTGAPALSLPVGGSVTSLSATVGTYVRLRLGAPAILFAPTAAGSFHLSLSHVVALGASADSSGDGVTIEASAPTIASASIEDTVARGGSGFLAGGRGLALYGPSVVTIDRSRLAGGLGRPGQATGLEMDGTSLNLARSDVSGPTAVRNGSFVVDHSMLATGIEGTTTREDTVALRATAPVSVALRDSVVDALAGNALADFENAAAVIAGSDAGTASLTATGTTMFAGRRPDQVAGGYPDAALLVRRTADSNQAVTAVLRNSVVRLEGGAGASAVDLVADRARIAADFSGFTTARAVNGGSVPAPGSAHNVRGDPRFAAAASGDFSLLPSSPLIDRGDPALVAPGEVDLAGNPRSTDGNGDSVAAPDLGAFERPGIRRRPSLTRVLMTRRVFAPITRSAQRHVKHGTRFRYTLSEAARIAIRIERRDRRVGVLRAFERAGRQWRRFDGRIHGRALRPGRYVARIVATDYQGAKSKPRQLTFRVVRP